MGKGALTIFSRDRFVKHWIKTGLIHHAFFLDSFFRRSFIVKIIKNTRIWTIINVETGIAKWNNREPDSGSYVWNARDLLTVLKSKIYMIRKHTSTCFFMNPEGPSHDVFHH